MKNFRILVLCKKAHLMLAVRRFSTCRIFSSCSSSSRKKVRYMNETSTSGFPPYFLCSSIVSLPPENACLLTCVNQIRVMTSGSEMVQCMAECLAGGEGRVRYLRLNLFGRVSQEDGGIWVTGAHLGLSSL